MRKDFLDEVLAAAAAISVPEYRVDQRVDIALPGSVIEDGGADGQPAIDTGGGWCRHTAFLKIRDDRRIEHVGFVASVAEANDIELYRRQQFQARICGDAHFEMPRYAAGARNRRTQLIEAVHAQSEPGLQRTTTA